MVARYMQARRALSRREMAGGKVPDKKQVMEWIMREINGVMQKGLTQKGGGIKRKAVGWIKRKAVGGLVGLGKKAIDRYLHLEPGDYARIAEYVPRGHRSDVRCDKSEIPWVHSATCRRHQL
jgi:hypothetical protein